MKQKEVFKYLVIMFSSCVCLCQDATMLPILMMILISIQKEEATLKQQLKHIEIDWVVVM